MNMNINIPGSKVSNNIRKRLKIAKQIFLVDGRLVDGRLVDGHLVDGRLRGLIIQSHGKIDI